MPLPFARIGYKATLRQVPRGSLSLGFSTRLLTIQNLTHLTGQLVTREGFAQELDAVVKDPPLRDDVGRKPGDEDPFDCRAVFGELLCQVAATHARHDHVGDQQVDAARMFRGQAQGLFRAIRGQHGVAEGFEEQRRSDTDGLLVLDQQDDLLATWAFGGG